METIFDTPNEHKYEYTITFIPVMMPVSTCTVAALNVSTVAELASAYEDLVS